MKPSSASANNDHRPWGYYTILEDDASHKVKRIVVHPGKRLSLQRHAKRAEHWFILAGKALVTLGEKTVALSPGDAIDIPHGMKHRIENTGTEEMSFIEIQTGTYFGEDDIERFADDFGRVP